MFLFKGSIRAPASLYRKKGRERQRRRREKKLKTERRQKLKARGEQDKTF